MSNHSIHAIETRYRGYRMRSRTEARWAVYFDHLGIQWNYEFEGYDLSAAPVDNADELGAYLPDFWLPQVKMWAEVKAGKFEPLEERKCAALALLTGFPCLMLDGPPAAKTYWAKEADGIMPENDYLLDNTYLDENRFYGCTGYDRDSDLSKIVSASALWAIAASREARFEHGESPDGRRVIQ